MNKDRWYWWLINVWMIVVGMGVTWFLFRSASEASWYVFLVLPVLTAIVGYVRTPLTSKNTSDDIPVLNRLGLIYLSAWKNVLRSRWILVVFGLLAFVNAVAYLTEFALNTAYPPFGMNATSDVGVAGGHFARSLSNLLQQNLHDSQVHIPQLFIPGISYEIHTSVSMGVFALAILTAILWIGAKLKDTPGDPEFSAAVKFARRIGGPLAVFCLAIAAASVVVEIRSVRAVKGPTDQILNASIIVGSLFALAAGVAANAFVISGILGSLKRMSREAVTQTTFVEDAVRYYRPMMGFYLVLFGPAFIAIGIPDYVFWLLYRSVMPSWVGIYIMWSARIWPLLTLAVMFAPFIVVASGNRSGWASVLESVRDWRRNAWDVLSLIAVGYSLLIVTVFAVEFLAGASAAYLPRHAPLWIVQYVAWPLFGAVTMIAVWEFHQMIGKPAIPTAEGIPTTQPAAFETGET